MRADLSKWREADTVFTGYVEEFESAGKDSVRLGGIRHTDYSGIARELPYPIRSFYVVATDSAVPVAGRIVRLNPPPLTDGPHLSYAIQWFAFAVIALVGAGIVTARSMHKGPGPNDEGARGTITSGST
jgi:surfeit locus 1 family protein